ncbi:phosphatidylinositol transfer protein 3-like [Oryza brachyantha]|uniref:CRAL-TRIO domain-containing protein n=1 Tax=Oryza brachyantha TaxID=4533 RepID=J3LH52_ORYBR|nr:phosphatidylinositol transfer protein 3-like [Oryza brachyantha]XP_006647907.1 phosphatidylinositol transfer protein 3-like [Oryza brachyantha]
MSSASSVNGDGKETALFEQRLSKIGEVRAALGQLSGKTALYCSDASIARYLVARNWDVKKATKMLKKTLKWRSEYRPDEIRWDEIANEAATGKIYRTDYFDKSGRSILVMRPGVQNTKKAKGQIRYLVYCMENAILNLPPDQSQMVWLIDFAGFSLSNISLHVTKLTADVLQGHYPERLGVAILYNAPKIFESFWKMASPILEPKTFNKVKFVYPDRPETNKIMEDLFNMEELESAFGGKNQVTFNINDYAARMREDDNKMPLLWSPENSTLASEPYVMTKDTAQEGSSDLKSEETTSEKREETDSESENKEETESESERGETEAVSRKREETEAISGKSEETEAASEKREETVTDSEKGKENLSCAVEPGEGKGITPADRNGCSSSDP